MDKKPAKGLTVATPFEEIPTIDACLFEVRAGIPKEWAEERADLCLHLAGELLKHQVVSPDSGSACIAELLVAQARACYQAAGASS